MAKGIDYVKSTHTRRMLAILHCGACTFITSCLSIWPIINQLAKKLLSEDKNPNTTSEMMSRTVTKTVSSHDCSCLATCRPQHASSSYVAESAVGKQYKV